MISAPDNAQMHQLFKAELIAIADWWQMHAMDVQQGGFWGEVAFNNVPNSQADKSIILNARILWFFSTAARWTGRRDYAATAQRAYEYINQYFMDKIHGGVYWLLNAKGDVIDSRKHCYAQAFSIYALAAYYELCGHAQAQAAAIGIFELLEKHAKDGIYNGYFEGFSREWGELDDIRLSPKEDLSPKTMNTHLHILEAYTGLLAVCKKNDDITDRLSDALLNCVQVYSQKMVDATQGYVRKFLTRDWQDRSHERSFGHDVESSWLILKAVKTLALASEQAEPMLQVSRLLAETSLREGFLPNGRMLDEVNLHTKNTIPTAWWVQVEAMIGFMSQWQLNGQLAYKQAALAIWQYTQHEYKDTDFGEWAWFAKSDVPFEKSEYKIGAWKAPYHNGRAMMMMADFFKAPCRLTK